MSFTISKEEKNNITLMLMVTEACNLECTYCYETNKTPRNMTFETAKKILDREFERIEGTEQKVVVQFFGGEPFVNFSLMIQVHDYLCEKNFPNFRSCFATTNGTLVHGEVQEWLKKHKETFTCGLSLDGTKKMHDLNRSNSYDKIDLLFFANTWPKQKIKMTVSPQTLPMLSDGVKHCHDLGFGVLCNLAEGVKWNVDTLKSTFERELKLLVDYYLENPGLEPCLLLNMPVESISKEKPAKFPKWCGCGTHIHAYDVEGNLYPCQMFMGISGASGAKFPEIKESYPCTALDKKCQNCILSGCCPSCMGLNYYSKGNLFAQDDGFCEMKKIQFLATSYLKYKKYKKGLLKLDEQGEFQLLNGIMLVQNHLNTH